MRGKGQFPSKKCAEWVDPCWGRANENRGSFTHCVLFADPRRPRVKEFLTKSAAVMEQTLADLDTMGRPRNATVKFPAVGSGTGARGETWKEWMKNTKAMYAVVEEFGYPPEPPMVFCPWGPWLRTMPPVNKSSKKCGAKVPCLSQAVSRCLSCLPDLGGLDRRGGVTVCGYVGCTTGVKRLANGEPKCLCDLATQHVLRGAHAPLALADARLHTRRALVQACVAKLERAARSAGPTVIIRSYGRPEFESYHAGKLMSHRCPFVLAICTEDPHFARYSQYYAR